MFEDINLASSIGRQWNDFSGLKCDHFFVKIKEYQNIFILKSHSEQEYKLVFGPAGLTIDLNKLKWIYFRILVISLI